jgi:cobalt-zinc-cadmium efflux system membrane fusion protein
VRTPRPPARRYAATGASCRIVLILTLTACAKDARTDAARNAQGATVGGDTALVGARGDTTTRAHDVLLTPEQSGRIRIATVAILPFRSSVQTTGTVAFNGDRSTQVLAPVSGPITKIMVNPGAVVRRGDPLATVTSPDFATAMAAYRKAQSAYRNAQRIADLDQQLFKNDAIARRELEQAQPDPTAAAALRDAALEQMRALGVDPQSIQAVQANRLSGPIQAVIRAPIEGTVVEKLCNPGQLIQAATTQCFTIADLATVWVMANVFESDLAAVAPGEEATVTSGALTTPVVGTVAYVGSLVDPASKATAVRIVTPNPRDVLKRDMLVNVSIRARQGRNGILVPTSAVLRDDQNLPFVFVALANNHFARRKITIGSRVGDQYEVTVGLTAGERIVVDGALFLQFAGSQ